jgi:hypothetical protein
MRVFDWRTWSLWPILAWLVVSALFQLAALQILGRQEPSTWVNLARLGLVVVGAGQVYVLMSSLAARQRRILYPSDGQTDRDSSR